MPTVLVTSIHATYVPVVSIHISIISIVTDPILTKLSGLNFLGVLIFVDLLFFNKTSFDLNTFFTIYFISWPKNFLDQIFVAPKFFWSKICTQNLFGPKFSSPRIFLDPKFFCLEFFDLTFLNKNNSNSSHKINTNNNNSHNINTNNNNNHNLNGFWHNWN